MPKLHLVGITPDHKGLVLSEHARSKRGDLVLEIDERLLDAIDKAHRLRLKAEGRALESAALPSRREQAPDDGTPGASRLTPREIQQRLRSGETVTAIARSSGVDEGWIERFAPPVFAEQARIIEKARAATFNKPRVGPSGTSLGPAVAANVIEKGVALTLPEIEDAWGAFMRPTGGWCVTFAFSARGRRQLAEWDIDPATGEVTAHNKLAAELAYREPGKRLPQPRPAAAPSAPSSAPSKAGKSLVTRAPGKKAAAPPSTGSAPPASGASPAAGLQTLPGTAPDSGETAPMAVPPGAGP
ncbi:MAG TPA: septation protein SepH, partial [Acidimicrobiia bacterium]|nr:septation protein SepH [Acidimicrobiia bacterium]